VERRADRDAGDGRGSEGEGIPAEAHQNSSRRRATHHQ
jgi:hypothetical protein